MEKDDKIVFGAIVFVAALFIWFMFFKKQSSTFTSQSFEGMTSVQATASFTQQTAQIVQEMKQKLTDAIAAGNTKEQLIAISDQYSQYSCDLSKSFQRFQINNMPITTGSPGAASPMMAPQKSPK